jgi:hypothetical protein
MFRSEGEATKRPFSEEEGKVSLIARQYFLVPFNFD